MWTALVRLAALAAVLAGAAGLIAALTELWRTVFGT
jgi:hypothetical protein